MQHSAIQFDAHALAARSRAWLHRLADKLQATQSDGDVDSVHHLRVASRRLSEPLLLMEGAAGRKAARRAQRLLKRVRDAFRVVRDVDVMRLSLDAAEGPARLDADDAALLLAELESRRARTLDKARAACAKAPLDKVVTRVAEVLESVDHAAAYGGDQLQLALLGMLDRRTAALREADPRVSFSADLHDSRIAIKRLRYATELLEKLDANGGDAPSVASLVEFQTLLGDWHDHVTAARWICQLASRRRHLDRRTQWSARLLEYAAARARAACELRGVIVSRWSELLAAVETLPTAASAAGEPQSV